MTLNLRWSDGNLIKTWMPLMKNSKNAFNTIKTIVKAECMKDS